MNYGFRIAAVVLGCLMATAAWADHPVSMQRALNDTLSVAAGGQQKFDVAFNEDVIIREFTFVTADGGGGCDVRISFNGILAKILIDQPPGGIREDLPVSSPIIVVTGDPKDGGQVIEIEVPGLAGIDEPPTARPQEWQPAVGKIVSPNDQIGIELIAGDNAACTLEYLITGQAVNGN